MSLNYSFLIDQVGRLKGNSATLLDYGCGHGELVAAAIARGHEAYGCDTYSDMWSRWQSDVLCANRIEAMASDGHIPFSDSTFDVVVANQVFEHIDDFTTPLSEIHRVLKPDGLFLNSFPTLDIMWEGHIKAPLAQWFFGSPRRWRRYLITMHWLHLGKGRSGTSARAWAEEHKTLPQHCFYKSRNRVIEEFSRSFHVRRGLEPEWIRHRMAHHDLLRHVRLPSWLDPCLRLACTKLAGRFFVLQKKVV